MSYKSDLEDALRSMTRVATGLASTLRQVNAGELDKLYPVEKQNIIRCSLANFERAKELAKLTLDKKDKYDVA